MIRNAITAALGLWLLTLHGHVALLGLLVYILVNSWTSFTNTAMTRGLQQRMQALVQTVGNLQNGVTAFNAIAVTGSAQFGGSSTFSVGLGVLGNINMNGNSLTSVQNCSMQMGIPPDYTAPNDGCSGSGWCSGERGYYNNLASGWNTLIGEMINRGLII